MCDVRGMWRVLAPILFGCLVPLAAARAQPQAVDARVGAHADKTRFVLELTEPVDYSLFMLARPYRVVIDLPEIAWRLPADTGAKGEGLVARFRYGLFKPGTSRIVLDATGPVGVMDAFFLPPNGDDRHRFVLDLVPVTAAVFEAAISRALPRPGPAPAPPATAPRRAAEKPVIVLDPGHGGVDPGAISRKGTFEKHVTLRMAEDLKRRLEASGRYRVVLTRESDVFVRLRARIARARAAGADLFISLHADSHRSAKVRGLSVYTLSETASDKEAEMLAAKENKADVIAGIDLSHESEEVTNILIDLAQRESMNESAGFAAMLTRELRDETNLLRRSHRYAGFAVLKAPDVPSVLIELGYLSNPREERMLLSKSDRGKLVAAIARAIDQYFARQQALSSP